MQYRQDSHTEQLDAAGRVTRQQDTLIIVRPGAPQELQVVSVKGDRIPADPDEAARQAQGQETERRKHDFSLKNFVTRFTISFLGQDQFLGQPVYLLGFEPKPNQPYRDQTEKVLDQLHGRMWISQRDALILKTEATLAQPVPVAWIFARISTLDFHYELRNASSEFAPSSLQVTVEVDAPLLRIRQRQTVVISDFEPRTAIAAAKASSPR
jgi:hypothetical protein